MTGFNKWFPHREPEPRRATTAETRAWFLRAAWYVSTLMLVAGYVLVFVFWNP